MLFFFMRHDFPEKMLEQELRDELKRVLGELPTGPLTKKRLAPLLTKLRKYKAVTLMLRRSRRESSKQTGLELKSVERGALWKAESESFGAGCSIVSIQENSPASREAAGGRLLKDDVVMSMHDVSFVKIGKAKIKEANCFKGHEQTLDMKVWRKIAEAAD